MQRRTVLLGTGTAVATALAGCVGSAQEGDGESSSGNSGRTITVRGSGDVRTAPDMAVLDVGVEATGDSAAGVRDELAERSDDLHGALVEYGIDEDDITTSRFYVRERVDERRAREEGVDPQSEDMEEYVYYEGTHSFRVEVSAVEDAGEVVDVAVDAGADDVGRITFTLSEERREELREDALAEAIDGARTEADVVAEQIGASVVEAKRVDTSGSGVRPVYEDVAMDAAGGTGPATALRPDDVTVSATVEVAFEMA